MSLVYFLVAFAIQESALIAPSHFILIKKANVLNATIYKELFKHFHQNIKLLHIIAIIV